MLDKMLATAATKLTEEQQVKLAALLLNNVTLNPWYADKFWETLEFEPKEQLVRQLPDD